MQPALKYVTFSWYLRSSFLNVEDRFVSNVFPRERHKPLPPTPAMGLLVSSRLSGLFRRSCDGRRKGCHGCCRTRLHRDLARGIADRDGGRYLLAAKVYNRYIIGAFVRDVGSASIGADRDPMRQLTHSNARASGI